MEGLPTCRALEEMNKKVNRHIELAAEDVRVGGVPGLVEKDGCQQNQAVETVRGLSMNVTVEFA